MFIFGKRKDLDNLNTSNSTQLLLSHSKRKSIINVTPCLFKNDPSRITSKTLFIMSSRVNKVIKVFQILIGNYTVFLYLMLIRCEWFVKVLGYGGIRGKLFVKHPDLFRYCIDLEDKDWLIKHKLHYISHNSSGSSFILILDDIRELLSLECYR